MFRRMYLLLLFCGCVFTSYCQTTDPCVEDDGVEQCTCSRHVDVAIVGAGPSGSYSAYRLRHENLSIEVFEYFNRVGGRLYSTVLPEAPDVKFELGGMIFSPRSHKRLFKVVEELELPIKTPPEGIIDESKPMVYIGGKHGFMEYAQQHHQMNDAERNSTDLLMYLFEKLTGRNIINLTMDSLRKAKLLDGRYLYSVPLDEALDMVASRGAKALVHDMSPLSSLASPESSLLMWENVLESFQSKDIPDYYKTPVEGMNNIPKSLMEVFLRSSQRHQLTLNRRLLSISPRRNGTYKLVFRQTTTTPMDTTELDSTEVVCARKVILGITKFALSKINWAPLRDTRVQEAINSVTTIPAHKVFLTFPVDWWMKNATYRGLTMYTDRPFNYFSEWGRSPSTGRYVVMASFCDQKDALLLHDLSTRGQAMNGSAPGAQQVTQALLDNLLGDLSEAFGIDRASIPEPISGISQFWSPYPFGGGWTIWRAGYRYDDVISTVQRPSLTDDVYYVGADHSIGQNTGWTEGALEAVDRVFDKYFL